MPPRRIRAGLVSVAAAALIAPAGPTAALPRPADASLTTPSSTSAGPGPTATTPPPSPLPSATPTPTTTSTPAAATTTPTGTSTPSATSTPTASAGASASPAPSPSAGSASPGGPASVPVTYRGVTVRVPADWQVVDLDADPTHCVRLDVKAVYVGEPARQQDCPAHLVGRSDSLWLHPTSSRDRRSTSASSTKVGALVAHTARNPRGRTKLVRFPGPDVTVDAAWGAHEAAVDDVLATIDAADAPGAGTTARAVASRSVARSLQVPRAVTTTGTTGATAVSGSAAPTNTFVGMGVDTCAAPTTSTMQKWYTSSPYRVMGIYIGGSMRACPDGNLNATWVDTVTSMGWGLMPIYVGDQAPCVEASNLALIDAAAAAAEGTASAQDAVSRAQTFGLGSGTPIYYDMEHYDTTVAGCTQTVLTFLSAWSAELHRLGYTSGAYGNTSSLMVDLSRATGTAGFTAPDDVWFAHWNGLQTLSDSASYPEFPDTLWSAGQRIHQYRTTTESWGGVSLSIDANWVGGHVSGTPVPVDYGPGTYGPGSTSFVFTGTMGGWWSNAPQGLQGRAYYTWANGPTEVNGATWSPQLTPGLYAVTAAIPSTRATAVVTYAITDADGSRTTTVDQSTVGATAALGTVRVATGKPPTVHLGDTGPSPSTAAVGVDAMTFRLVATSPSAPGSVSAVPGDARATVRWAAAADNGSPVTAYTVTASPGGASVTTSGTARSAVVPGLRNGTAYTFTVYATNRAGTGPTSSPSAATVPLPHGHLEPVAPTRLLDTRAGTATNPVKVALGPGAALTVKVAGVTGSPVPAGATSAAVNLTVTAPQTSGFLSVDATTGGGSSTTNYVAGQTVANLVITRLTASGTMTIVNHSKGSVHVVADVEGYFSSTGTTRQWKSPAPVRLLDTRVGTATNPVRTALGPGAALTVKVAGVTGSPVPAGAVAAGVNLTVTGPTSSGFLSVDATTGGGSSTTNYVARQTVANLVITRLTASGTMTIVNHSRGSVHVVADVEGYLAATGTTNQWVSTTPVRLVDTRAGTATNAVSTAVAANASIKVRVAGITGSPVPAGATVAAVNLTVTAPQKPGFLTADASADGGTSTANFAPNQTVANLVLSRIASDGTITVVNHSAGSTHVVIDVQGYLH